MPATEPSHERAHNASNALNHHKAIIVALALLLVGLTMAALPIVLRIEGTPGEILGHLGIFLVPTGLITLVYELVLRRGFLAEVREQLAQSLQAHFGSADRLAKAGIVDVHDCMPDDVIARRFAAARSSICILQTWIPNLPQIERAMAQAIGRGCRVRILLLDADSVHCSERSRDLGHVDRTTIRNGIELNLKQLAGWLDGPLRAAVEVRTYRATPTMSLYACDDARWLGLFWRKRRCSQGPHVEIGGADSVLGHEADRHFEDLWDSGQRVDFARLVPEAETAAV